MATLSTNYASLADWAKRRDPDGKMADVAELLSEDNEIVQDALYREANGATSHRCTIRTGLPAGTFRLMNQGVNPEKSTTSQVDDAIASLASYNDVDADIATLEDDLNAFLLDESMATLEGMSQTLADTVFYGDTDTNPEKFHGLMQRYNSASAGNAENFFQSSGSGSDGTSIWLINWNPKYCFMTYPKGSKAGLSMDTKGKQTIYDSNNLPYEAYRTYFNVKAGLTVKDWRGICRIQLDTGALTKDAATGDDIFDEIAQALEYIHGNKSTVRMYCNRTVSSFLRRQRASAGNVRITQEEQGGQSVTMVDGIPVRRCDAITNTETII